MKRSREVDADSSRVVRPGRRLDARATRGVADHHTGVHLVVAHPRREVRHVTVHRPLATIDDADHTAERVPGAHPAFCSQPRAPQLASHLHRRECRIARTRGTPTRSTTDLEAEHGDERAALLIHEHLTRSTRGAPQRSLHRRRRSLQPRKRVRAFVVDTLEAHERDGAPPNLAEPVVRGVRRSVRGGVGDVPGGGRRDGSSPLR
mmetsp:Transcript_11442/g.53208  ORF Transcript_11442/g.53208 Transcript_11442/m.53208 type:complete len:205 (-) Transcript_11442:192-806(-)